MADKEVVVEVDDDADFDAGFAPAAPGALTDKEPEEKDATTPPPENKDDTPPPPPPADATVGTDPPPPVVEYVQLTKEQLARLEAAADKNGEFEKRFSTIFGTLGGVQELVKKLQSETPTGAAIAIPDDAFLEMEEDYPQLAKHFRSTLEKTLKSVRGTGAATASDPEELNKLVNSRVAEGVKAAQVELLEDSYPDWREIVGAVDRKKGEEPDPNNAFRKWLATQPADYATKVTSSHNATILSNAIAKFKADTKPAPKAPQPPSPKIEQRKKRFEAAVTPKGDGNPPPATKTGDDDFDEGFNARNRHRTG